MVFRVLTAFWACRILSDPVGRQRSERTDVHTSSHRVGVKLEIRFCVDEPHGAAAGHRPVHAVESSRAERQREDHGGPAGAHP